MAGKDIFTMSQKDIGRLHIIQKTIEGNLKQKDAAELLSLGDRQTRRIVKKVKTEGAVGIIHKSRGKPSNSRLPDKTRNKAIELYRKNYEGFGPTLASEKLLEREGITVNDETLRLWLIKSGDWKKTRKDRKHRQWREREHHFGEMLQIDGSHHDWFEGRGPKCVLMGYIDDATGKVFGGFYDHEGTIPAMDSFKRYSKKYGIPVKAYLDKHTTYKSPGQKTLMDDKELLSQFQRAMKELGVRVIHAHSPQAKGRIERLFRTFQDRAVKEMRLRGIKNIEEANNFLAEYLLVYNSKFSVKAKDKADLHRKIPKGLNLDRILCIKTTRTLRNDFTIAYKNKLYQITDNVKADEVTVEIRINKTMLITHNDVLLKFKEIIERPEKQKKPVTPRKKTIRKLRADHPWKKMKIKKWKRNSWVWAA
jgi:hypothetical protein